MDVVATAALEDGGTVTYRRLACLPGIEAMHVTAGAKLWRVFHETYTIASIHTSRGDWRYRGRSLSLTAQELSMMEPGETHTTTSLVGPCDFHVLHLQPSELTTLAREMGADGVVHWHRPQIADAPAYRALARLHRAIERRVPALELSARLVACVELLLKDAAEAAPRVVLRPDARRALRGRDLLEAKLSENVSLEELAAAMGLGRFEALRAFERQFGLPPHAFHLQRRLNRARRMLQDLVAPGEVAAALGFADQSHFSRHFKRSFGVAPGAYAGR